MANDNPELLEIFLEEATDLIAALSTILREWEADLNNLTKITDLKREMHTLKGSARMVGQTAVATLTHEMETLSDALAKGEVAVDRKVYDQICLGVDLVSVMIEAIRKNETPPSPDALIEKFQQYITGGKGTKTETPKPTVAPEKSEAAATAEVTPPTTPLKEGEVKAEAPHAQEVIRIRSSLLETLNSLSSENNMIRVGIEQQIYSTGDFLRKLKQSVKQLDSQLSILSTEASVLASRRTGRQQFHSNFIEAQEIVEYNPIDDSNDIIKEIMLDLKNNLGGLSETYTSMESMLLHQNRITSELQHRLAETRLTPFESIVPRLSRIARQVSMELNKQVDFKVNKSQGEMDRTVLEHLVPSLEHILRNALDHGIEPIEQRKKLGKPEIGKIEVNFIRSGSMAAIQIKDDGGGINPEAIRQKAIKMGLLKPDVKVSDEEVIRYILEPGFSTRDTVTQVSGRGVGMDVVNTAVNELGGTLLIASEPGKGTIFTVRFPFTSSLNRILLFTLAGETYGITLTGIEGVTSMTTEEVRVQFSKQPALFRQGEKGYYLHYLSSLLNPSLKEVKPPQKNSYPIILISSSENAIAIIVDTILFSRDLLVQSLGGQFKLTEEFSGATLLGDGRAVLIFDPESLTRKARALQERDNSVIEFSKAVGVVNKKSVMVMVVDDSASARAVIQQALQRHHYQVITAEDGAAALLKLEAISTAADLPDILLLDIDMPRMNGLELTSRLRESDRFKNIPIVILSADASLDRREQAKYLGVQAFLAKPIDELQIIATMQAFSNKGN